MLMIYADDRLRFVAYSPERGIFQEAYQSRMASSLRWTERHVVVPCMESPVE